MEFKTKWLLQKVDNMYESKPYASVHKKTVVAEDDEYYYVTSEIPKKILKSELIDSEFEALYNAMKNRLESGMEFSRKQKRREDVINALKNDFPQYFI